MQTTIYIYVYTFYTIYHHFPRRNRHFWSVSRNPPESLAAVPGRPSFSTGCDQSLWRGPPDPRARWIHGFLSSFSDEFMRFLSPQRIGVVGTLRVMITRVLSPENKKHNCCYKCFCSWYRSLGMGCYNPIYRTVKGHNCREPFINGLV